MSAVTISGVPSTLTIVDDTGPQVNVTGAALSLSLSDTTGALTLIPIDNNLTIEETTTVVQIATTGLQGIPGPAGDEADPEDRVITYTSGLPTTITAVTWTKTIAYNVDDLPELITYTRDDSSGYTSAIAYDSELLPITIDVTLF